MSLEVANTIKKQIMAGDYWALARWGANQYIGYSEGNDGFNGAYILGGLGFKIRTPKYPRGVRVTIYLNGMDTYDIRICRINGTNLTELDFVENIYCDQLAEVIDRKIENERKAAA